LRARLNPHFLFNALNSVNVLARSGKAADTTRVVEGLTTLLRYVLDERRPMVPLREELEFARQYLDVQQVRFGDRLTYDLASEPIADTALVPQLLLQPIVENAVEHGVATTLAGGRVVITALVDGGALMITVDDDGPGPPAAGSSDGVGLATTRERLRRLYAERATLTIGRRPACGTRVAIALPLDTSTTPA
jgi:sensor histidine kinase YesM